MSHIISKLERACVASCTCLTKTPDFEHHAADCRYRVLSETIGHIAEKNAAIANLAKIIANHVATAEEDRLRIRDAEEDLRNYRTSAEAEIAGLRVQVTHLHKLRDAHEGRERELIGLLAEVSRRFRDTPNGNSLVSRIERAIGPAAIVKCPSCKTTNTAKIGPTMWQCSCGNVFERSETGNG